MGLKVELDLQGNDFSNIATFLFVALLCFEIPNSMSTTPTHPLPPYRGATMPRGPRLYEDGEQQKS